MSDETLNWVIADYADAVSAMGEEIRSLKMDKDRLTSALAAAEAKGRREGAEAAAKVIGCLEVEHGFSSQFNAGFSQGISDAVKAASVLYEVAPHQEKETR